MDAKFYTFEHTQEYTCQGRHGRSNTNGKVSTASPPKVTIAIHVVNPHLRGPIEHFDNNPNLSLS